MNRVHALLGVPTPDARVDRWHVSPSIDLAAYAFSWLWVLVPLLLMGDAHPTDYIATYILIMTATFVHRHFTLPYVYFDRQVFSQYPWRFVVFPTVMLVGFVISPFAWSWTVQGFPLRHVVAGIAFFAGVWNLWHVYSQKYGILRLYNAKSGGEAKVPGWVDRLLIFGWMPLYFIYLGPAHKTELLRYFPTVREYTQPTVEAMERLQPWLLAPTVAVAVGSVALFLWYEWRTNGLGNAPRLWMATGMTLLSASFLVVNPVKAYMAFAFSHAVEYMVFVWAYQRRRYHQPLPHRPLLGRMLRHPFVAYAVFVLVVGGIYFLGRNIGRYVLTDMAHPSVGGVPVFRWIFYWGVYQSMVHFYFDGFLWKMRLPAIRQNI